MTPLILFIARADILGLHNQKHALLPLETNYVWGILVSIFFCP